MRKKLLLLLLVACAVPVAAQQALSLDSCRALAMRNNKQLGITQYKKEAAKYTVKAAKTQYLPKLRNIYQMEVHGLNRSIFTATTSTFSVPNSIKGSDWSAIDRICF